MGCPFSGRGGAPGTGSPLPQTRILKRIPDVLVIEMKLTGKTEFVSSSLHTRALRLHSAGQTWKPALDALVSIQTSSLVG